MPANDVIWPVPLQRLTPWYPGQMGVPGTDSDRGLRLDSNGIILYVDPNHVDAGDNKDGTNPDSPLATVEAAIGKCRAYSGDVIVVMFNGYWTYGDATESRYTPIAETVTVDVPGIRIVGVSSGSLGVPWVPTANNGICITVDVLDVTIEGFNFWEAGGFTGTTGISARWDSPTYFGENLTVRHCYFYNLDYGIQLDYTWYCHVEDCRFDAIGTAAIHNPSVYGEPDYLVIRDCIFTSNTADINLPGCDYEVIEGNRLLDVTAGVVLTSGAYNQVHSNIIQGDPTGASNYINTNGGGNNILSDNWLGCTLAQYAVTCNGAATDSWLNNHCINGDTVANAP